MLGKCSSQTLGFHDPILTSKHIFSDGLKPNHQLVQNSLPPGSTVGWITFCLFFLVVFYGWTIPWHENRHEKPSFGRIFLWFLPTTWTKSRIRFAFVGLFSFNPHGCVLWGGKKDSPKQHMLFKMGCLWQNHLGGFFSATPILGEASYFDKKKSSGLKPPKKTRDSHVIGCSELLGDPKP